MMRMIAGYAVQKAIPAQAALLMEWPSRERDD
jgi:hypothetical protein